MEHDPSSGARKQAQSPEKPLTLRLPAPTYAATIAAALDHMGTNEHDKGRSCEEWYDEHIIPLRDRWQQAADAGDTSIDLAVWEVCETCNYATPFVECMEAEDADPGENPDHGAAVLEILEAWLGQVPRAVLDPSDLSIDYTKPEDDLP